MTDRLPELDAALLARIAILQAEGRAIRDRFEVEVRQHDFHPFIPADYDCVLEALLGVRAPGLRFLEWGSGSGVITIMADLLGFDAAGIELDASLVAIARDLARRHDSRARFVEGSFLPAGYEWCSESGDRRLGTIGVGDAGYTELGVALADFDLVFGYPWSGEEPMMLDIMRRHGGAGARLLVHGPGREVRTFRAGELQPSPG
ncbi:MAG: hypothetical protein ACRELX_02395 [Longimicrobiales bacterium]